MKSWITYRTRFLIKAKQLSTSLTFVDLLGRHQSGRKGDYLVESADGVLSIAPRQIFEDIYVPLQASQTPAQEATGQEETTQEHTTQQPSPAPQYESQRENQTFQQAETKRQRETTTLPLHLTRKSPQPDRNRRPSQGLSSL
ncbi:MAG: hypothetical protein ABSB14_20725 [Candidatus Sulfotelmatobacter sp.]|jgi:hypothetical protein